MASSTTFTGTSTFTEDGFTTVPEKNEWGVDVLPRSISGAYSYLQAYVNSLAQGQTYLYPSINTGTSYTSGLLIPANQYKITTYVAGDDFTNVGAGSNATNVVFIATGKTPTTWTNGSTLLLQGTIYYLQTWGFDKAAVFPKVDLIYKGLSKGIPDPFVVGETIDASMSRSTSAPVNIVYYDFPTRSYITADVNATIDLQYRSRRATWKYIAMSSTKQSGTTLTYVPPTSPTYTALDVAMTPIQILSKITLDNGIVFGSNAPAALVTALTPAASNKVTTNANPIWGSPFFECTDIVEQLLF